MSGNRLGLWASELLDGYYVFRRYYNSEVTSLCYLTNVAQGKRSVVYSIHLVNREGKYSYVADVMIRVTVRTQFLPATDGEVQQIKFYLSLNGLGPKVL
jgi:hypothetical protein